MNNYRVTFSRAPEDLQISYYDEFSWKERADAKSSGLTDKINFRESNFYFYPYISRILNRANDLGIAHIWFFYELEPNVEITWLSKNKKLSDSLYKYIEGLCKREGFVDLKYLTPADGKFGDWYHVDGNEKEREFGAKRHSICRQFVQLYNEYRDSVDTGKGIYSQTKRTIHCLCNGLGLNYKVEAQMCLERFLECSSFYSEFWRLVFKLYKKFNKNYSC